MQEILGAHLRATSTMGVLRDGSTAASSTRAPLYMCCAMVARLPTAPLCARRLKIKKRGLNPDVMLARQTLLNCAAFEGYGHGCDGGDTVDVFGCAGWPTRRLVKTHDPMHELGRRVRPFPARCRHHLANLAHAAIYMLSCAAPALLSSQASHAKNHPSNAQLYATPRPARRGLPAV